MTGQGDHRQRCTVSETGTAQVQDSGKGIWLVKIIAADVQGTYGLYPSQVLQRDGAKAFPAGTHYYLNHSTESENQKTAGVRRVQDMAGVQIEGAYFSADGPLGPGLYARTQLLPQHRETVESTAPHAGVSINALAVREYAPDAGNYVVTELIQGLSVDFVSRAGAGGKLVAMTESAPVGGTTNPAAPGIFHLAEADKQGLQKLYEAVTGVAARLIKLEEAAATAQKPSAAPAADSGLSVAQIVAALDGTQLPAVSRQRVASSYTPGTDIKELISSEQNLVDELKASIAPAGSGGAGAPADGGQSAAGGTTGGAANESGRVQLTQESGTTWEERINAMFLGSGA